MQCSNLSMGIGVVASVVCLGIAKDAHAEIQNAFINTRGDIEIEFVDNAPPTRAFDYHGRAQVEAKYVCARGNRVQPRRQETVAIVIERTERFAADFQGRVHGVLTLNQPIGQASLRCQGSFSVQLASVRYTQIEIQSELGMSLFPRDIERNFLAR
ncbi:MAG TPA: hypothetical protein PK156_10180 [Polyangium sp.]|nr:hypothetical protein [Polyangium sp.]